jgi:hypothetical protein
MTVPLLNPSGIYIDNKEFVYLRNWGQHFSLIKTCIQNAGDNLKEA